MGENTGSCEGPGYCYVNNVASAALCRRRAMTPRRAKFIICCVNSSVDSFGEGTQLSAVWMLHPMSVQNSCFRTQLATAILSITRAAGRNYIPMRHAPFRFSWSSKAPKRVGATDVTEIRDQM